ncbi:histone deacetylase [Nocardia cyriacigeorgica]|uniref:histone deacetylase n=1 Tax=Nocardia cyriacigeorgica TaxID=135487 RepID=UPI0024581BC1|nr:histone deacetylase [Nocardia cyriacigeorgica]
MSAAAVGTPGTVDPDLVWYASYGSNMNPRRLECYLRGGVPEGGVMTLPGCRDTAPPRRSVALLLPGMLYFATESAVWTGGRAFYDPDIADHTAAHAYLLTAAQFSDIAAQEMYRAPGADLDFSTALGAGRARFGPGRYETLVYAGTRDGYPILTFTAPWGCRDVPGNPPAAAYLRHLAHGLIASHGWTVRRTATYLATRPGAAATWTTESVIAVLDDTSPRPRP